MVDRRTHEPHNSSSHSGTRIAARTFNVTRGNSSGRNHNTQRSISITLLGATLLTLGGCASRLSIDPGPYAAEPVCASVIFAVPDELLGFDRFTTTSQGTAAWGPNEGQYLALRCGMTPPEPSEEDCVTIETFSATVDWLVLEEENATRLVTYGRQPAAEIYVPAPFTPQQAIEAATDMSTTVAQLPQFSECL